MWAIPLKNKYSQTIESDAGTELYNSIFQNFLKSENMQHYSRYTDKGPFIAERVIRTIRNSLKKPIFLARNADWLSELSAAITKYNISFHNSIKLTPIQASKKVNEKEVYSNLQDRRDKQQPKYKLGQLFRTANIKRTFSTRDSTNYSYKLYTITEIINNTIPSYRINYLPERYNEKLLLPTKLSLEQNNQFMTKINLIQKNKLNKWK